MSAKKIPRNIKFEKQALDLATERGLNLADICRRALDEALSLNRCYTCGQPLPASKKTKV